MVGGLVLYVVYRRTEGKPVLKRVTVPATALRARAGEAEYGSILVPVLGTPLDDDIMQTAGRLAADEDDDEGEGGAVIEALWVFEVPMSLPLDARAAREPSSSARARRCARAKAVGEEYEGVEVATATVRARRAGQAIVRRGPRRGVEAIVLAAEEPSRMRGGALLGGTRRAAATTSSGRHPLRGRQGAVPRDPHRAARPDAPIARDRRPRPAETGRRRAAVVWRAEPLESAPCSSSSWGPAGSGRRSPSRRSPRATRSRCSTRTRSRTSAWTTSSTRSWEEAGGRFTVGTALEIDALHRGRHRARPTSFIASTNGDNTNLVVAQIAQRRFEVDARDRARARPAPRRLVPRAGPARRSARRRSRSSMLEQAVTARREGPAVYVIIAGAGKVGWNLARELHREGPRGHAASSTTAAAT